MKWMKTALDLAEKALNDGEVPVGCIFIYKEEIIAIGSNQVNETHNATRHAELICIDRVLEWCENHQCESKDVFKDISVYVTVEPCIMCTMALQIVEIKEIIYGCKNYRFGGCSSVLNCFNLHFLNPKVIGGIEEERAMSLLKEFYKGTNPNAPTPKIKK